MIIDQPLFEPNALRGPVDTNVPVVLMPAWANPGYVEGNDSRFWPTWMVRRCHTCDVEWFGSTYGTLSECWICKSDDHVIEQDLLDQEFE